MTRSIQFQLSLGLVVLILVAAGLATTWTYSNAYEEAIELQDSTLSRIGLIVQKANISSTELLGAYPSPQSDEKQDIFIQAVGGSKSDSHAVILPPTTPDGMQSIWSNGNHYRVLVLQLANHQRVAIGQDESLRSEVAKDSALIAIAPYLIISPLIMILVVLIIRKAFLPTVKLSERLDSRSESDLRTLPDLGAPEEIRPFIDAINRLLERISRSVEQQKRFIADAAHELRTPLTALSLQVGRLLTHEHDHDVQVRLQALQAGLARNRHLVEQLLSQSRSMAMEVTSETPISLKQMLQNILADFMPIIEDRSIEISLNSFDDLNLLVNESALAIVLKNLISNAIQYVPDGGMVEMSAGFDHDHPYFEIEDNGPGIPEESRKRALDAFYRLEGNATIGAGLGLSIVKNLTDRWNAALQLSTAKRFSSGLRVRIEFPRTLAADL